VHYVVESVLTLRGYTASAASTPGDHATTWRHESLPPVDVHHTLGGLRAPPEDVWKVLSNHGRELKVAGVRLPTLNLPALALHAALHATHHGQAGGRTIIDLERALLRIGERDWRVAFQLAAELDGLDSFATGLRLAPAGRALAKRLGAPQIDSALAAVRADSSSGGAWLLANVSDAQGLAARLRVMRWALVPPPAVMRAWYPDRSIATAYLAHRPLRIVQRTPRAVRELHRARRAMRDRT